MFCEKCGKMLEEGARFCDSCGAAQTEEVINSAPVTTMEEKSVKTPTAKIFVVMGIIAVVFICIIFGLFKIFGSFSDDNVKSGSQEKKEEKVDDDISWGWSEKEVEKFMEKKDAEEIDTAKGDDIIYVEYEYEDNKLGDVRVTFIFDEKEKLCSVEVYAEEDDELLKKLKDKYGKGKEIEGLIYWDKGTTFGVMQGEQATLINKKHELFKEEYELFKENIKNFETLVEEME